jgi:hypothetical protein
MSALVDVPRVHMPRAVKAFSLITHWARIHAEHPCARVEPRVHAAMDRARQAWAEAERTRDEALARRAARHFDEVASLLPPGVTAPPGPSTNTQPMHLRARTTRTP